MPLFEQDRGHYQHVETEPEGRVFLGDGDHPQMVHLASLEEKKRLWWRNAIVTGGCVVAWFIFALLLSVYNKWMFSEDRFGFPYPLFVTSFHMWIQFAFASLVRAIWPASFRPPEKPTPKQYGKKVLPTALATCLDIGFSNLSLREITLTFYTMVKNSSLIFVLIFAFLFRLEPFSFRLIGVISLILIGVVFMVATETAFSLSGFFLVITASACSGLRWSLTQLLLRKDSKRGIGVETPPAALFWMAPAMGILLASLSMLTEGWIKIFSSEFFDGPKRSSVTWLYILLPGSIAFCMVISEFYFIQRAGVVPMSVAGILKEVATISVSAWIFGDQLTPLNVTGAVIAFSGIILFTYHKYLKSIESPIPLDAHGNPIPDAELDPDIRDNVGLQDSQMFNGHEYSLDAAQSPLFSAALQDDSGDEEDHGKARDGSQHVSDDTRSVVRESMEVERLWNEERRVGEQAG